jgi:hypothetical protein
VIPPLSCTRLNLTIFDIIIINFGLKSKGQKRSKMTVFSGEVSIGLIIFDFQTLSHIFSVFCFFYHDRIRKNAGNPLSVRIPGIFSYAVIMFYPK